MNESKRYDLVTNYRCGSSIEEMEPADDGEWVRWDDLLTATDRIRLEHEAWDKARLAELERLQVKLYDAAQKKGELQHELDGWRELGEEIGRIVSAMTLTDKDAYLPDWFGPRLFDLQVKAAQKAAT